MQLTNLVAAVAVTSCLAAGHVFADYIPARGIIGARGAASPQRGCGSESPPKHISEQMNRLAAADTKYSRVQAAEDGVSRCHRTIVVKTWIHAAVSEAAPDSYLNNTTLQKQLEELNRAYSPHDVMFVSEGFTRTVDNSISELTLAREDGNIAGSPNPNIEAY